MKLVVVEFRLYDNISTRKKQKRKKSERIFVSIWEELGNIKQVLK